MAHTYEKRRMYRGAMPYAIFRDNEPEPYVAPLSAAEADTWIARQLVSDAQDADWEAHVAAYRAEQATRRIARRLAAARLRAALPQQLRLF